MKIKSIFDNIKNKAPKVLLIIVVLFGLSYSHNSMFGRPIKVEPNSDLARLTTLAEKFYGQKVSLQSDDEIIYDVLKSNGSSLGHILSSTSFSDVRRGYAGKTPIAVFLDSDRKITSVQLLKNNETRSFVNTMKQRKFFDAWIGQDIDSEITDPDAVTGVTLTSSAVIANFDEVIKYASKNKIKEHKPIDWASLLPQFAVLGVVILSLLCYFYPAKTRKLRIPVLILSIGVLGIWQGAFVSIELFYKWLLHGVSFSGRFALVTIVALALLIPLLFSRSWYCMYLCPFGALQELIGKINSKKLQIPRKVLTLFRWIRQLFLITIIVLLFLVPKFDPSTVEPFTVFLISSAAKSVIIISAISLISSIFIQKAWCRLLCPTGELMSILQRRFTIKKNKK